MGGHSDGGWQFLRFRRCRYNGTPIFDIYMEFSCLISIASQLLLVCFG